MASHAVWPPRIQASREPWLIQRETEAGLQDPEPFPVVKRGNLAVNGWRVMWMEGQ